MSTALLTLTCLIILPYLLAAYGGLLKMRQHGKIDNRDPRQQAERLDNYGKRVYAAQHNAWEALAVFSATLLIAYIQQVSDTLLSIASLVYLLTRIAHPLLYLKGLATLRSLDVVLGWLSCLVVITAAL
ncbi:MAPEG family protein [Aliagarivorans taiwanensis]|uniref:MAPEG family protein n=1 Tax=Aliagarivorans taiwanensis TaxID=561966 RepID=UPI0003F9A543|nr:MAPEG family protein [Aliagarivorans taiwanensis]